jgi:hypothetical protein
MEVLLLFSLPLDARSCENALIFSSDGCQWCVLLSFFSCLWHWRKLDCYVIIGLLDSSRYKP